MPDAKAWSGGKYGIKICVIQNVELVLSYEMDGGKAGKCDKKHISFTACKNVGSELY